MSKRTRQRSVQPSIIRFEITDANYISNLTGIWLERYQRLYRLQRDRRRNVEMATRIAYNLVKRWKEEGVI